MSRKLLMFNKGDSFGKLTVIKDNGYYINPSGGRSRLILCSCECGTVRSFRASRLNTNEAKSCGCASRAITTYGESRTPLCYVWRAMIKRCYSLNKSEYISSAYFKRGIKVCDEWRLSYSAFKSWALKNGYLKGLQIDRINNNGNYEPSNCRWVTAKENSRNKRSNRFIEINGVKMVLAQWAEISGIHKDTISDRIKRGWKAEDLLKPVKKHLQRAAFKKQLKTKRYEYSINRF